MRDGTRGGTARLVGPLVVMTPELCRKKFLTIPPFFQDEHLGMDFRLSFKKGAHSFFHCHTNLPIPFQRHPRRWTPFCLSSIRPGQSGNLLQVRAIWSHISARTASHVGARIFLRVTTFLLMNPYVRTIVLSPTLRIPSKIDFLLAAMPSRSPLPSSCP